MTGMQRSFQNLATMDLSHNKIENFTISLDSLPQLKSL